LLSIYDGEIALRLLSEDQMYRIIFLKDCIYNIHF
jgi:hypothetical protein